MIYERILRIISSKIRRNIKKNLIYSHSKIQSHIKEIVFEIHQMIIVLILISIENLPTLHNDRSYSFKNHEFYIFFLIRDIQEYERTIILTIHSTTQYSRKSYLWPMIPIMI